MAEIVFFLFAVAFLFPFHFHFPFFFPFLFPYFHFRLPPDHQKKQCAHSKIVVENNFNLPPGSKILWVHSDEKWMKALVPRSNAKSCEELGVVRDSYSVHHKCHIDQVTSCPLLSSLPLSLSPPSLISSCYVPPACPAFVNCPGA